MICRSSPSLIPTILLAEDEPTTRHIIQTILHNQGFAVQPASDGDEGCALIDELTDECPQLLITDMDMPGCCGDELAQHARQYCDRIKLIFTSGTPQPKLIKSIAADPQARFIKKPFLAKQLLAVMQDLGISTNAPLSEKS